MIKIAAPETDFFAVYEHEKRPIAVYGIGEGFRDLIDKIGNYDILIDKNVKEIESYDNCRVYKPKHLESLDCPLYILVTVKSNELFQKICRELEALDIDAIVFDAYRSFAIGVDYWGLKPGYKVNETSCGLNINIVCRDTGWILRKFAQRMNDCLIDMGYISKISDYIDKDADINHHIQFASFHPQVNDTLMISHVDSKGLFDKLKEQLDIAAFGICMSKSTMDELVSWGIPRNKLAYIHPAHDGVIKPRKQTIGITHKTHEVDLRKKITALFEMLKDINPQYFRFIIMGNGWEKPVDKLRQMGFETDYYPDFIYEKYVEIVPTFDYYLFYGFDEGSMGYLDAVSAGVKTIVTPQGFHVENGYKIDYPCRNVGEFNAALLDIQRDVEARSNSVREWTWESYTKKHVSIWNYILHRKSLIDLYSDQLRYEDGIYSILLEDNKIEFNRSIL